MQVAAEVPRIIIITLAALVYILPFIITKEYCLWGIHVNSLIYYLLKWVKIVQGNYPGNFICPSFNTSTSKPFLFFLFPQNSLAVCWEGEVLILPSDARAVLLKKNK